MSDPVGGPTARDGAGSRPATGVGDLADLLVRASGRDDLLTSAELAELLWLARYIEPAAAPLPELPPEQAVPPEVTEPPESGPRREPPEPPSPSAGPHRPERPTARRVPLRLPDVAGTPGTRAPEERTGTHRSLLAPAPPMLSHPLALQRALRPLKRRVPAPVGLELDEEATAHRIARLGTAQRYWLPVPRAATERWLTLHLVYDSGPTMPVWAPLVRELHTALAQSGVFRTVALNRLAADGTVHGSGGQEPHADGRTVTLLISDCTGPQWREGPAGTRWYGTLRGWTARMPVTVVQPLPERLWRTTALPTATARIGAPWPAAPNSSYGVDSYIMRNAGPGTLALPVMEASAPWLANWSRLLAHAGRVPGSVAPLGTAPPPLPVDDQGRGDVERLTPEELVLRFGSLASSEAFRLAGHLAVGRPRLPVMRLIQAAVEPNPRPQHLAEVILSGMMAAVPGGPPGTYAWRAGVRELLLRTLPRTARDRTADLLARMGGVIDERAGLAAGEFRVAAPGDGPVTAEDEPFATVREESVHRLGGAAPRGARLVLGRYRTVRDLGRGSRVWRAEDTRGGRTVAVYRYEAAGRDETATGRDETATGRRRPRAGTRRSWRARGRSPMSGTPTWWTSTTSVSRTAPGGSSPSSWRG